MRISSSRLNCIPRISEHLRPTEEIPELVNTGERFLPGAMFCAEVGYDHFTRYHFAERYLKAKKTIELGSGVGYGSHSLAKVTESILGVDLSEEAVAYAARRYQAPNLRYEVGNVADLPYEAGSFEAAVSFEVIEHLERPEELVLEAKRLIGEHGIFVISTPDKQTYSNARNSANPHHLKEMYPLEFREILERSFEHVQMFRQGALAGSMVIPDTKELPEDGQATLESAQFSLPGLAVGHRLPTTLYMVAVCTNREPAEPLCRPLLILDRDRQVYEEYEDLRNVVAQLQVYQGYQQPDIPLQVANMQLQRLRQEMNAMQSTRGWRVARGINMAITKLRSILRIG